MKQCPLKKISGLTALVATLILPHLAQAEFTLIDNFENYPNGNVNADSSSPWTGHNNTPLLTIGSGGGLKWLAFGFENGHRAGSRGLPEGTQIALGDEATVFVQFWHGGLTNGSDQSAHFGLTHNVNTSANAPSLIRVETRMRPHPEPDYLSFQVRDGGEWRELTLIPRHVWINLWYVIDRTNGNSFRIYLNTTNTDATETDLLSYEGEDGPVSTFSFRDSGSESDLLDSFVVYGHTSNNRTKRIGRIQIDNTGANLSFIELDWPPDPWEIAYAPFTADFDLLLGSDAGRSDGTALLRPRPHDFLLKADALDMTVHASNLTSTAAMASVENYLDRQDFVLESTITLRNFGNFGPHRAGLAVLGHDHVPGPDPFDVEDNQHFYGFVWLPAEDLETSRIQIRHGFNGAILANEVWKGLHPSGNNQGLGGINQPYHFVASGEYDPSGQLVLTFTLTDVFDESQSISTAPITNPLKGNMFGFGGRMSDAVNPRFDVHNLSLSLGDEPREIEPIIPFPFSFAFGAGAGRNSGEDFLSNLPADWSLEEFSLRLTTDEPAYHSVVRTAPVSNLNPTTIFTLRARATLTSLSPDNSDNRIALVLFAEGDRDVFDASDDGTFHTLQLIPHTSEGAILAFREGIDGEILAETSLSGVTNGPIISAGSIYDLEFTALYKLSGNLVFIASLTDEDGGNADLMGEVENPPSGNRFGFGAWHRAAEDPVWDFHEFQMSQPSVPPMDARYSHCARVTGKAQQAGRLGYSPNDGRGYVGSSGSVGDRRHHNVVLGFDLPMVAKDEIIRFDLNVTTGSRADVRIRLYGLLPAEPWTYHDGSITAEADGVDLWYEGPVDGDTRSELLGARWGSLIPPGAAEGSVHSQDVTDFIRSFYDEDGPTQERVFFRLSPIIIALADLARTEIQENFDQEDSPRLTFLAYPFPEAKEPEGPTFQWWRAGQFTATQLDDETVSGAQAAPAGDGITNLLKYAFGFNSMTPVASANLPQAVIEHAVLRLTYPERRNAQDIFYRPGFSYDLTEWASDEITEINRTSHSELADFDEVTIEAPATGTRGFLRVLIVPTM
jgi:hypothetical protein